MWRVTLICLLTTLAAVSADVRSQETEPVRKLMNLKMDYMQQLLESIIKQDFQAINDLAFRLGVLAGTEDWKVIRTEEYSRRSADFRGAVEAFQEASKGANIDDAAPAYAAMTLACVHCHKYVREYRTADEQQK